MTYKSKVLCDACQREEEAPGDGGFPFGWAEINFKARKTMTAGRTRFHVCDNCLADVVCIGEMIAVRNALATVHS